MFFSKFKNTIFEKERIKKILLRYNMCIIETNMRAQFETSKKCIELEKKVLCITYATPKQNSG